jgi:hypothetical protein
VANLAMKRYALSTLEANGKSKISQTGAAVHAVPMLKATAHWSIVARVNGELLTAKISSFNPAWR